MLHRQSRKLPAKSFAISKVVGQLQKVVVWNRRE
jgi:hypothetical protein